MIRRFSPANNFDTTDRTKTTVKTSEMIIEFAGDFIETGDSMEQRQSRLNAVCTAWNIANLPKHERRKALERYVQSYRDQNPGVQDSSFLRKDYGAPNQTEKPAVSSGQETHRPCGNPGRW